MCESNSWHERLTQDGFVLITRIFSQEELRTAEKAIGSMLSGLGDAVLASEDRAAYGARNILTPEIADLARKSHLKSYIMQILGTESGVVRGLYFDKPPGHSWALPWHRDLNIAVRRHGKKGTFTKATTKSGVPHVQAPVSLLSNMLTARIHIDAMNDYNGPLRVVPGSHLTDSTECSDPVVVRCSPGDVLLMRPLVLHSSSQCAPEHTEHRRIIHLECAPNRSLPDDYEWHDFISFSDD